MELIAILGKGEGTWAQVSGLMNHGDWEKIILVGEDFAKNFTHSKKFEFIKIDFNHKLIDLKENFWKKLKNKFKGMELICFIF